MRNDRAYVEDMLEAIELIEKYTVRGRAAFDSEELIRGWIVQHIQIIGEAIGKLSPALKAKHPEVPWDDIKAMRNVLVHFYFGVKPDKVWRAATEDLPVLKRQLEAILKELPS
jgi:uncharacterized protein with HEPN domain